MDVGWWLIMMIGRSVFIEAGMSRFNQKEPMSGLKIAYEWTDVGLGGVI